MKNIINVIITFLLSASFLIAVEIDPTDYTLIGYELTEEQENQFDLDGELSDFWLIWDADNEMKLDYVHELPSTHGVG